MKKRAGFSLLEVVAAAALIGVIVTFMAPSIKGAYGKVADSKLRNDLTNVGQAVQLYQVEKQKYPDSLSVLFTDKYINTDEFKDAQGAEMTYDSTTGQVSGKKYEGGTVTFNGHKLVESAD
ncbi:MAG: type II secretion system protein [Phascolarctobacterium sp.]|nr:type II secretion system protein [Candidatus Phascolarctobacterium caballi]